MLLASNQLCHLLHVNTCAQVVEGECGELCTGEPFLPTWGMVMEYVVKSATGHPSTPKGGTPEYRNGPWYKAPHGKKQGDSMGAKKAYGYGSYAGIYPNKVNRRGRIRELNTR